MNPTFEGVTIDPATAQDLDDAISVSRDGHGWTVQVAFPDLTEAIQIGSGVDLSARRQLSSIYRGGGSVRHMLPDGTVRRSSLTPERRKDVFLVTIAIGRTFKTETVTCTRASFQSKGRLSYDEASEIVRTGEGEHAPLLRQARDLAYGLFDSRRASGAIALYDLERGIAFDEEGAVILLTGVGHVAEMIVREFMILANACLAMWAAREGIQILYRNHSQLSAMTRDQILANLANVAADADVKIGGFPRLMDRAKIGVQPIGHYALALPAYAWFTSPLRRYVDLVNQRMISAHLSGAPAPHDVPDLTAIAEAINLAASEDRSESFKASALRNAGRLISAKALGSASNQDFGLVVKVVSETPQALTETVVIEGLRRIASGTLTGKEMARLLLLGGEMADGVIARLIEHPHEAVSILKYGELTLGWGEASYDDTHGGPAHARVFASKGAVTVDGIEHTSPMVVRITKKGAQQAVAVHLLAAIAGVVMPTSQDEALPDTPAPLKPKPAVPEGVSNQNPRNRLQEFLAKRRLPLPTFVVSEHGPPNDRTFKAIASVVIDGKSLKTEPVPARSRKDAEKASAAVMLTMLGVG